MSFWPGRAEVQALYWSRGKDRSTRPADGDDPTTAGIRHVLLVLLNSTNPPNHSCHLSAQELRRRRPAKMTPTYPALASHNLRFLTLSQKISQIYATGSQEQRRLILHEFFAETTLESRELRYKWTKAAEVIAKVVQNHPKNEKFELAYNALEEPKIGPLETLKTIWYRLASDLRTLRGTYNEACDEHVRDLLEADVGATSGDSGDKNGFWSR